jgi:hypothetical protein
VKQKIASSFWVAKTAADQQQRSWFLLRSCPCCAVDTVVGRRPPPPFRRWLGGRRFEVETAGGVVRRLWKPIFVP